MNGEDDVLSAEGKALMMRPASAASPFYGFGWFVDSSNAQRLALRVEPRLRDARDDGPRRRRRGSSCWSTAGSGVGFGETTQLRNAITAEALGLDYSGEGSRLSQKALFVGLALLPIVLPAQHRSGRGAIAPRYAPSRARSPACSACGSRSSPRSASAWVIVRLVPTLFGAPLATLRLFQPDWAWRSIATAVTGVLWAVFRLGVAYAGRFAADPAPADHQGWGEAAGG